MRHGIVRDRGWLRSAVADNRKEELFHSGSALDLVARHGPRHPGGMAGKRGRMTMMLIVFSVPVSALFSAGGPVLVPF